MIVKTKSKSNQSKTITTRIFPIGPQYEEDECISCLLVCSRTGGVGECREFCSLTNAHKCNIGGGHVNFSVKTQWKVTNPNKVRRHEGTGLQNRSHQILCNDNKKVAGFTYRSKSCMISSVAVGLSSFCVFSENDFHRIAVSQANFMYRAVGLEQVSNTCILCSPVSLLPKLNQFEKEMDRDKMKHIWSSW